MKKSLIILSVLVLITFIGCRGKHTKHQYPYYKKFHNGISDVNCYGLPLKEREFASKLSNTHKQVFCKIFTKDQREKTIELFNKNQKSKYKTPISEDQAVEKIIKSQREKK